MNTLPETHPRYADPDHSVHELIARRFSPYGFDPRPVEDDKLARCLEAARWAASSYNEQPWRFLVARRQNEDEFQTALSCLVEANQRWAGNVGVLILTAYSETFGRNGKDNRVALHDLGLAAGNICLQATALGLSVHQMAGVDLDRVRQTYGVPEGFSPATAIAIGYADMEDPPEGDSSPRSRKELSEVAFSGSWGRAAKL